MDRQTRMLEAKRDKALAPPPLRAISRYHKMVRGTTTHLKKARYVSEAPWPTSLKIDLFQAVDAIQHALSTKPSHVFEISTCCDSLREGLAVFFPKLLFSSGPFRCGIDGSETMAERCTDEQVPPGLEGVFNGWFANPFYFSVKDFTEVSTMLAVLEEHLSELDGFVVIVPGDGKHAQLGWPIASKYPTVQVVSVDPLLQPNQQWTLPNLREVRCKVEELVDKGLLPGPDLIVLAVHSHAPLQPLWDVARRALVIENPCCFHKGILETGTEEPRTPDTAFDDVRNMSSRRQYRLWHKEL